PKQQTTPDDLPVLQPALERPPAYVLPPVDEWAKAKLPFPDPLLDRPDAQMPGFFFDFEPDVVWVHFRNELRITVPVSATQTDTVQFFGPGLNPAFSPRFEFGCRLDDGWGDLLLGYRFLSTEGSRGEPSSPVPATTSGRLDFHTLDLCYAAQEFALGPCWDMRWRTGVRGTVLYYDARLDLHVPAPDPGTLVAQRGVNYFWGIGPLVGLDLSYKTAIPGLALFVRLQGALNFGRIDQTGTERFAGAPNDPATKAELKHRNEVSVPMASEEFGVSYVVPEW